MEGCGLAFSACFNCVTSGNYLVKLASNFSYCCTPNPATLSEPVMFTYSKLSDCPPDMMSTYILAGTIGSVGLLACIILMGFCIPNFLNRQQIRGSRMPPSRFRYQREQVPLLATVSDLATGQPNYGFTQDLEHAEISHEAAALSLGSVPSHIEMSPLPEPQQIPKPPQLPVRHNDDVYRETVAPTMNTFRSKRPTTLAIRNPVYENIEHFSFN